MLFICLPSSIFVHKLNFNAYVLTTGYPRK